MWFRKNPSATIVNIYSAQARTKRLGAISWLLSNIFRYGRHVGGHKWEAKKYNRLTGLRRLITDAEHLAVQHFLRDSDKPVRVETNHVDQAV
jgi:hypothetical protein